MRRHLPQRKSFVALFDILGFEDLLNKDVLQHIYNVSVRVNKLRRDVNQMGRHIAALLRNNEVSTLYYSDTFLMYTRDISSLNQSEVDRSFHALLASCDSLFIAANENRLPIRGAITVGEIIVSKNMVLGKPIVDAYKLERNQEWIGCTISKRAMESISENARNEHKRVKAIVEYKVPCKNGIVKKLSVFNWTQSHPFCNGNFSILWKAGRVRWDIERKHRNTLDFIQWLKDNNGAA